MNWIDYTYLGKKYPKANNLLIAWDRLVPSPRDLYDFFDENGIYIYVLPNTDEGSIEWEWRIIEVDSWQIDDSYHNSRTEAETSAFQKAFEILENKLVEPK